MTLRLGLRGQCVLVSTLACVAALLALSGGPPLLRVPLGFFAVLILPGYAISLALIPLHERLPWEARTGLGIALSVAILTVTSVGLDLTPGHLSPRSLVVTVTSITLVASLASLWHLRAPRMVRADEDSESAIRPMTVSWQTRGALTILAVTFTLVAVLLTLVFRRAYPTTEMFVLGSDGNAQSYPRQLRVGDPIPITIGVTNREGSTERYRIMLSGDSIQGALIGPLSVSDGETTEQTVDLLAVSPGKDQVAQMVLYREGMTEPYRQLRLVFDVVGRDRR